MSHSSSNQSNPEEESQKSTVNSQILDSIKEINELIGGPEGNLQTVSNQVLTQAVSMAMLNIVNQQQNMFILQNTVTTVAAKAMLSSNPEEAMKLMNTVMESNNVAKELRDLKEILADLDKKPS